MYRLTEVNYSNGDYYHYEHDAIGNRLTSVNGDPSTGSGQAYTWDNNGNLFNDGANTYIYNSANRLKTFTNATTTVTYAYDGLNDRLQETVNGVTTTFTMDLNTGLTQALSDGTNHYIYGVGRIAQVNTTTEYFLGDALGSVRQLTDASGAITYSHAYDPYGVVTATLGDSQSAFGYTGESYGDSTQLLYLRSRFYASTTGRFLTRDTWGGDYSRPLSLNPWLYVEGDPVNRIDPTGRTPMQAGYVEGFSIAAGVGEGTIDGREIVYDYATMTRARFIYDGKVGGLFASIGAAAYLGKVNGFHYGPKPLPIGLNSFPDLPRFQNIIDDYSDDFDGWYAGGSPIPNVTGGIGTFHSPDGSIKGSFSYLSLGKGIAPFELVGFHTFYKVDPGSLPGYENTGVEYYYDTKTRRVNTGKLISDILTGDHSPLAGDIPLLGGVLADSIGWVGGTRTGEVVRAIIAANRFEKYYYQPQYYGQCRDGYPPPPPLPDRLTNPFPIPTPGVP